jgi:hypothetical protein
LHFYGVLLASFSDTPISLSLSLRRPASSF